MKQIVDNLSHQVGAKKSTESPKPCSGQRQEIENNFQFYIKFNVAHVTSEAKHSSHTNQPHANSNDPANPSSINWFRNINSIQRRDIENRFFIFGLFFLNGASNMQPASTSNEDSTCQQPHPAASYRLVFISYANPYFQRKRLLRKAIVEVRQVWAAPATI